ncbi:MAG: hypothetical protein H6868_07815 [Rhodospirillales bacterium]|nr:hypothetical protein [Rhodospirillales bacterium]
MMVMLISVPSYAQSIDPDKIEGIPRFDELSDEEFNDNTLWIEESPKKNAYLAYKIRLPYDWERSELSQEKGGFADDSLTQDRSSDFVSRSILGLIAKYNGPSNFGVRSYIEVRAKELTRIISARNWFIHFVLTNGYSLEGMEMLSENRVEGLYVQIINDVSYAVRVICELNGNQVVLMSYYMPVSRIKDEKALQEKIVGSFHFIDPEKPEVALTRTYSFMGVVHFDYPYSLRLPAPKVYSFSEMELQLINAANNNKSSFTEIDIHIMAHDKVQSLAEEVLLLKQRMEKEKIKIGDMREVYKRYEVGENIDFHRVEVYNAEGMGKKIVPHEYWIAILRDSTYFYIISMLTTGRTSDFYTWAQNVEALGVIFKTIGKGPSPRMEKDKKAEAIAPPSSSSSVP